MISLGIQEKKKKNTSERALHLIIRRWHKKNRVLVNVYMEIIRDIQIHTNQHSLHTYILHRHEKNHRASKLVTKTRVMIIQR